jgi:small conductance mechanosensitive channel
VYRKNGQEGFSMENSMISREFLGLDIDFTRIFSPTNGAERALEILTYSAIAFVIAFILLKIEKRFFEKRIIGKKDIKLRFTQGVVRGLIITIAVIWVLMSSSATASFGKVLFQGTTLLAAVVGLAAQATIADLFAGFMISVNKPFEIGDRIELDNGVRGVVLDITPRHVVIRGMDTIDYIIPNSKVNSVVIINMSHNTRIRSINFRFSVAYGTDVEKAMEVIRDAVIASEHTIPAWKGKDEYGPVYFIAYADSSLQLATTVYYNPTVASEVVMSDINLRVNNALKEAGIEIPFNYMNVVLKDGK